MFDFHQLTNSSTGAGVVIALTRIRCPSEFWQLSIWERKIELVDSAFCLRKLRNQLVGFIAVDLAFLLAYQVPLSGA